MVSLAGVGQMVFLCVEWGSKLVYSIHAGGDLSDIALLI